MSDLYVKKYGKYGIFLQCGSHIYSVIYANIIKYNLQICVYTVHMVDASEVYTAHSSLIYAPGKMADL